MALEQLITTPVEDLDTPCLLLDLDTLEKNVEYMAGYVAERGVALRPHVKTHKSPVFARKQMAAGAIGVCCQKVGEAEVMVAGGIEDILVSNEVVGRAKIARLAGLARHARIAVVVDNLENVEALGQAARDAGVTLDVLIEVDIGQSRCGVPPGEPAVALGKKVVQTQGLALRGLQGYHGALQHCSGFAERKRQYQVALVDLKRTKELFDSSGLPTEVISGGGTGTYRFDVESGLMTEIQPGSYVVMDRHYRSIGGPVGEAYEDFECALFVLATVMSIPGEARVVTDAGLKVLSTDSGMPAVVGLEGAEYQAAGDEHGKILLAPEGPQLRLGDKVRLLPSHCDTTINLHDTYYGVRAERVEVIWPVAARGRSQ
ncbi:MAG: DSD1 family PLP-dependent enzyme [Nitrospinota bacterium]